MGIPLFKNRILAYHQVRWSFGVGPNLIGLDILTKGENLNTEINMHGKKTMWGHRENQCHLQAEEYLSLLKGRRYYGTDDLLQLSEGTNSDDTLILDFQPPGQWNNKFPCYKFCSLWYFALVAPGIFALYRSLMLSPITVILSSKFEIKGGQMKSLETEKKWFSTKNLGQVSEDQVAELKTVHVSIFVLLECAGFFILLAAAAVLLSNCTSDFPHSLLLIPYSRKMWL